MSKHIPHGRTGHTPSQQRNAGSPPGCIAGLRTPITDNVKKAVL